MNGVFKRIEENKTTYLKKGLAFLKYFYLTLILRHLR